MKRPKDIKRPMILKPGQEPPKPKAAPKKKAAKKKVKS